MNDVSKKWIDAFKKIEANPSEKIICPECNKGFLILKDVPIASYDKNYIDRYLICEVCGRREVVSKAKI